MPRSARVETRLAAMLVAVGLFTGLARGLELESRIDAPWIQPSDEAPEIVWSDGYAETIKANEEAWEKELEGQVEARRRLQARLLRLHWALLDRFPDDPEPRLKSYREITQILDSLKLIGAANDVRLTILEEFPDDDEAEARALEDLLRVSTRDAEEITDAPRWVETAVERILVWSSSKPPSEKVTSLRAQALLARFDLLISRDRLLDARALLQERSPQERMDLEWRRREADLVWSANDGPGAIALLDALLEDWPSNNGDRWRVEGRRREIEDLVLFPSFDPALPENLSTLAAWRAVVERPGNGMDLQRLDELRREDWQGRSLVPQGPRLYRSLWAAAWRLLATMEPSRRRELAEVHEAEALRKAGRPRRSEGSDGRIEVYRRYPLSETAQLGFLDLGLEWMREGRTATARRVFADLVIEGVSDEIRDRARVGLWLALAQERETTRLEGTLGEMDPLRRLPWLGGTASVEEIRSRLLLDATPKGASPGPPRPALQRLRVLRLPPVSLAPFALPRVNTEVLDALGERWSSPVVDERSVVLASPEALVVFEPDATQPSWVVEPPVAANRLAEPDWNSETLLVPSEIRPCVLDGRVITRWELDESGRIPKAVAAFDLDARSLLWSTSTSPLWHDSWPSSDPIVVEGTAYVLVVRHGRDLSQVFLPVELVALDAANGAERWRTRLATARHVVGARLPHRPWELTSIDVAHYGGAAVFHEGAVYCSSSLGVLARVDARDGLVEWCHVYPRTQANPSWRRVVRRDASAPIVISERIAFTPRDWPGVLVLHRDTGEVIWSDPMLPSCRLLGAWNESLLLQGVDEICAVRVDDGSEVWRRRWSQAIRSRAVLSGESVYALADGGLVRIRAETGEVDEAREAPGISTLGVGVDSIAAVSEEPAGFLSDEPQPPTGIEEARHDIPTTAAFWPAAEYDRPYPRLLAPPPGSSAEDRVVLLSDHLLEALDTAAPERRLWTRSVARVSVSHHWFERSLVLVHHDSAEAIDLDSGARRWKVPLPFEPEPQEMSGRHLVLLKNGPPRARVAVLDVETGQLLWDRVLGAMFRELIVHALSVEGDVLHLVGQDRDRRENNLRVGIDVVVRLDDGTILSRRQLPQEGKATVATGRRVYHIGDDGFPVETSLDDPPRSMTFSNPAEVKFDWNATQLHVEGRWLQVRVHLNQSRIHDYRQWIYRADDPDYFLHVPSDGEIRGDTLFHPSAEALDVYDLPSQQIVRRYALPAPGRDVEPRILGVWEDGRHALVVTGLVRDRWQRKPIDLRADVYARSTGSHVDGRFLPDVAYWYRRTPYDPLWKENQVAWIAGRLYVTEPQGLTVLEPGR